MGFNNTESARKPVCYNTAIAGVANKNNQIIEAEFPMTLMQQMPASTAYLKLCAKLHGESLNFQVRQPNTEKLIGNTPKMLELIYMIGRFSKHKKPVLIVGEPGTGKKLVAKIIHNKSFRHAQPFICVNFTSSQSSLLQKSLGK